jgi:hypothetical protein
MRDSPDKNPYWPAADHPISLSFSAAGPIAITQHCGKIS